MNEFVEAALIVIACFLFVMIVVGLLLLDAVRSTRATLRSLYVGIDGRLRRLEERI